MIATSRVDAIDRRGDQLRIGSGDGRFELGRELVDAHHRHAERRRLQPAAVERGTQRLDARRRARARDRVAREDREQPILEAAASVHASGRVNADGAPSGSRSRPQISVAICASSFSRTRPLSQAVSNSWRRASIEFHNDIASTMSCV